MNHRTIDTDADGKPIIDRTYDVILRLDATWGSARLGLILTRAYFQRRPLSTEELAHHCAASTETIRRWLKPLININRVRVLKEGRNVRYKATAAWARRTCEHILTVLRD